MRAPVDNHDPLEFQSRLLDALFSHEAPFSVPSCHRDNTHAGAMIRCLDCDNTTLSCIACTLQQHQNQPLHRIHRWNGSYYEQDSLARLGLIISLGHIGNTCPSQNLLSGPQLVTVMDITGLHYVRIGWCRCFSGPSHSSQLFALGWIPATLSRPTTAFTFRVMKHFQMLSHVARMTPWDFCIAIQRLTDNIEPEELPVSQILWSICH